MLCLAVTLCLSACGKTDSEQQSASVPFGTYVYTSEDGSTSQITVDAHTFRIQNGDYSYCAQIAIASRIFAASAEVKKEGLQLSDAEKTGSSMKPITLILRHMMDWRFHMIWKCYTKQMST